MCVVYTVWCMFIAVYIVGVFNTHLTHSRDLCERNTPQSSYTLLPSMSTAHSPVNHATWAQWISEGTEPHRQGSNSPESTLYSLPFHQPGAQRSRTAVGADAVLKAQTGKEWLVRTCF